MFSIPHLGSWGPCAPVPVFIHSAPLFHPKQDFFSQVEKFRFPTKILFLYVFIHIHHAERDVRCYLKSAWRKGSFPQDGTGLRRTLGEGGALFPGARWALDPKLLSVIRSPGSALPRLPAGWSQNWGNNDQLCVACSGGPEQLGGVPRRQAPSE